MYVCRCAKEKGIYEFIPVTGEMKRSDPQLLRKASMHIVADRTYLFGSQWCERGAWEIAEYKSNVTHC